MMWRIIQESFKFLPSLPLADACIGLIFLGFLYD